MRFEKTKGVATALKRLHVDRRRFRSEIRSWKPRVRTGCAYPKEAILAFWKIWCNSSGGSDKIIVCVGKKDDRGTGCSNICSC